MYTRANRFKIKLEDREVLKHYYEKALASGGILAPSEVVRLAAMSQAFLHTLDGLAELDKQVEDRIEFSRRADSAVRLLERIWELIEKQGVEMPL